MKMLVCVSGKEQTDDVVKFASRLATDTASQVVILHVQPKRWSHSRGYVDEKQKDHFVECFNALPEHLEQFVEEPCQIMAESGVQVRPMLAEANDPAEAILQVAEDEAVDMIVCGATVHRMVERLFQPSITAKLLDNTDRPVLVVPQSKRE